MKRITSLLTAMVLMSMLILSSCSSTPDSADIRLMKIEGENAIFTDANGNVVDIAIDAQLYTGYGVETDANTVVFLELDVTTGIVVDVNSKVKIVQEGSKNEIELVSGEVGLFVSEPLSEGEELNVIGTSLAMSVRGTLFSLISSVNEYGEPITEGALFSGTVEASSPETDNAVTLEEGNKISIDSYNPNEQLSATAMTKDDITSSVLELFDEYPEAAERTAETFNTTVEELLAEDIPEFVDQSIYISDQESFDALFSGDVLELADGAYVAIEGGDITLGQGKTIKLNGYATLDMRANGEMVPSFTIEDGARIEISEDSDVNIGTDSTFVLESVDSVADGSVLKIGGAKDVIIEGVNFNESFSSHYNLVKSSEDDTFLLDIGGYTTDFTGDLPDLINGIELEDGRIGLDGFNAGEMDINQYSEYGYGSLGVELSGDNDLGAMNFEGTVNIVMYTGLHDVDISALMGSSITAYEGSQIVGDLNIKPTEMAPPFVIANEGTIDGVISGAENVRIAFTEIGILSETTLQNFADSTGAIAAPSVDTVYEWNNDSALWQPMIKDFEINDESDVIRNYIDDYWAIKEGEHFVVKSDYPLPYSAEGITVEAGGSITFESGVVVSSAPRSAGFGVHGGVANFLGAATFDGMIWANNGGVLNIENVDNFRDTASVVLSDETASLKVGEESMYGSSEATVNLTREHDGFTLRDYEFVDDVHSSFPTFIKGYDVYGMDMVSTLASMQKADLNVYLSAYGDNMTLLTSGDTSINKIEAQDLSESEVEPAATVHNEGNLTIADKIYLNDIISLTNDAGATIVGEIEVASRTGVATINNAGTLGLIKGTVAGDKLQFESVGNLDSSNFDGGAVSVGVVYEWGGSVWKAT